MKQQITCKVESFWDAEAKVLVATSADVPGLVTEADSIEALSQKLREIIPELVVLNKIISSEVFLVDETKKIEKSDVSDRSQLTLFQICAKKSIL